MFDGFFDGDSPWRSPEAAWLWVRERAIDIGPEANRPALLGRGLFLLVLAIFSIGFLTHPIDERAPGSAITHLIHLPFHEAGHFVFQGFGRFIHVLGGTLMQLLVPVLVVFSFLAKYNPFGSMVGLWWLGNSLMDCAPYINDARAGQLELLGGVTGSEMPDYHDWEVMLKSLGMLKHDHSLAWLFWGSGALLTLVSLVWGVYILRRQKVSLTE